MSVGHVPAWAGGRRTQRPFGELRLVTWGALAVLAAAGVGYGLSTEKPFLAFSVALFPLVLWLWVHPTVPLVLLGASIPFVQSLGGAGGSYSVALSDLLLVLIGSGIAVGAVISKSATSFAALRPVGLLVLQFAVVIVLLLPFHFGLAEVAQTAQRLELFLLPLLVGAFAALHGKHIPLLQGYVVSTTVLAVVWQFNSLGMQKNPVGQFIANAILVLVALPALRRLLPCVFVLIPALFLTESRGAVIATAIGTVVIVFFHEARLRTALTRAIPLIAAAVAAFVLMPASVQERVTTLSAGTNSPAAYALSIRQAYSADAQRIISDHPWTGIGIGNYLSGDPELGTRTDEPHHVLLLQAAEGGYALAASFVILILGIVFVLHRLRYLDLATAAAGVLVATVAHGLVDVYWVRGTPVLAWLLVGMTCGALADRRRLKVPT